ncbi:TlpA disulfide reductase family protein [Chitinophaga silvisoli]|uniref:Thioredoxin domain-containing protein n=1 Tax=Chitinophaga silvisoli TaxID=2291814 RepID=A0A3E1NU93_9BACT|nr:TlpA disulfide reductase family protein [Chitinophaga silvisoli]RFM31490.1 hypothetical protein DXN04_27590 [Chitinophaga silvisoli]
MKILQLIVFSLLSITLHAQTNITDSLFINKCLSLMNMENPQRKIAVLQEVKAYTIKGDEETLLKAANVLFYMGMPIESDSIYLATAQKYPNGNAAQTVEYSKIIKMEGNSSKVLATYNKWVKHFPDKGENKELYENARAHVAVTYAKERNYVQANKWLATIKDTQLVATTNIDIADLALNNNDTISAIASMETGIKIISSLSGDDFKEFRLRYLMKYADFLYHLKRYEQALTVISDAYSQAENKTAEQERLYANILLANNKSKEAMVLLSGLLKKGKGDEKLLVDLKNAYLKVNGNVSGYDAYIQPLIDSMKITSRAGLDLQMLDEKAPSFSLRVLNGNTVSLEDLKGKIVILDFWATWCGPCKASFPAMKSAMNRYAADSSVVFLFIDCMERVKDPSNMISNFLSKNEYPFKVLLDSESIVADQYGIKGIPNKIIIDKNGVIRFRIVGFEDGTDAAVEKLSAMIEQVRKG